MLHTSTDRRGAGRRRRPLRWLLCTGMLGLLLAPGPAAAAVSEIPDPTCGVAGVPNSVGDTDARVYAIAVTPERIYLGGDFTEVVCPDETTPDPDDTVTVARRNLVALDAVTGALDPVFAPEPGNAVRALVLSPDGSRLYAGGPFARIGGADRRYLAALDPATGLAVPTWQADADAPVWALALGNGRLYAGGMFTRVTDAAGPVLRSHLAAVDPDTGAVDRVWAPVVGNPPGVDTDGDLIPDSFPPGTVRALALSPDEQRLYVGGEYPTINGAGRANFNAVRSDGSGGIDGTFSLRQSTPITIDITVDDARVYIAAGGGGGRGRAYSSTGALRWEVSGNGDFQAVAVMGGLAYFGGHFGTNSGDPFEGQPRSKLAAVDAETGALDPFNPYFNSQLGVWTLLASGGHLHVGGDFRYVATFTNPDAPPRYPALHYARLARVPEAPGAPAAVSALAGDGAATVSWAAPLDDGGSPLTGYVVTPYRDGVAETPQSFGSTATTQMVTGLANGRDYTFTVRAVNAIGAGAESAPSAAVSPVSVPGAPRAVTGAPGDGRVTVEWVVPLDDGGSPLTGYVVTPYRDGAALPSLVAASTAVTVPGLVNGVPYTFRVSATNGVGTGLASAPSSAVVPRTVPAAPTGLASVTGDQRVTLSWVAPADDGGSPVTGYVVTPYRDGVAGAPRVFDATVTVRSVTGLDNGVRYTFTVAAVNAAGTGPALSPSASAVPRSGYWMLGVDGRVYTFGDVPDLGGPVGVVEAVDLEPSPSLGGYWVVDVGGRVFSFGDAGFFGGVEAGWLVVGERVTSLSATRSGGGYWVFTSRGRVLAFGDAVHLGDMSGVRLNGPVSDSIVTPSGRGYYMVASDGGIFTFGDAGFFGSMGAVRLNAPVQSMVPDGDGSGYWLVASDGGVFAFEAPFRGSMGEVRLNRPVTGMVRYGDGYLMVGEDGGIFNFSDLTFRGSLGSNPPERPIVAVAAATT